MEPNHISRRDYQTYYQTQFKKDLLGYETMTHIPIDPLSHVQDWVRSLGGKDREALFSIGVFYTSACAQVIGKCHGFHAMAQFHDTSGTPRLRLGRFGLIHPIELIYDSLLYPFESDREDYLELFHEVAPYIENNFYAYYGSDDQVREALSDMRELYLKWIECPETEIPIFYNIFRLCIGPRRIIQEQEYMLREELESVSMPFIVNNIPRSAFWGCHRLERVEFSKELKTIEESAFGDCYMLKDVTFPDGLEAIGAAAFFKCFQLEYLIIPKSVRHIGKHAFGMCHGLKHVLVPKETLVEEEAFYDCPKCVVKYY